MPNSFLNDPIYHDSEVINQDVTKILNKKQAFHRVPDDQWQDYLMQYANHLTNFNNDLDDEEDPPTREEFYGVITRCLTLHSEECETAKEVVTEFFGFLEDVCNQIFEDSNQDLIGLQDGSSGAKPLPDSFMKLFPIVNKERNLKENNNA